MVERGWCCCPAACLTCTFATPLLFTFDFIVLTFLAAGAREGEGECTPPLPTRAKILPLLLPPKKRVAKEMAARLAPSIKEEPVFFEWRQHSPAEYAARHTWWFFPLKAPANPSEVGFHFSHDRLSHKRLHVDILCLWGSISRRPYRSSWEAAHATDVRQDVSTMRRSVEKTVLKE